MDLLRGHDGMERRHVTLMMSMRFARVNHVASSGRKDVPLSVPYHGFQLRQVTAQVKSLKEHRVLYVRCLVTNFTCFQFMEYLPQVVEWMDKIEGERGKRGEKEEKRGVFMKQ